MKKVTIILSNNKIEDIKEKIKGFAKLLNLDEFEEEINEDYKLDNTNLSANNTISFEYFLSGNVPDDIDKSCGVNAVKSLYAKYKKVIEKNFGLIKKAKYKMSNHSHVCILELDNDKIRNMSISVDTRIKVWSIDISIRV